MYFIPQKLSATWYSYTTRMYTHTHTHTHSHRHIIYAPSSVNSYGSSLFPGIQDTILGATLPGMEGSWDDVAEQVDIVRNHLRYATQILNEPSLKYAPGSSNWFNNNL